MATLKSVADQIGDKLAELVTGPVVGTIAAQTAIGEYALVEQGQLAALPDGRRVRVTKTTKVDSFGTAIPVRLEHLSPAYPAKQNFVAIASGTAATWLSPPSSLPATGLTSAFTKGGRAGSLKIGSLVETDTPDRPNAFVAGAQGDVQMLLVGPACRYTSIDSNSRRARCDATWKLRVVIALLGTEQVTRNRAREVSDALSVVLLGAWCGNDPVAFVSWQVAKEAKDTLSWDLTFRTLSVVDGRAMYADDPDIDELGIDIRLPGDGDQPSPFHVSEDIDVG